ncbi:LytR family transcriptional regulator [Sporosarcina sp. P16a]|uniref:LCP family glycopolymer transferase n=1 Tax=unclassified Sporosarcina TaxID=2647733 RepID=UPI000C16EB83|nr:MULTISPECIES: LCP family protein [unclassified Sporosarcina]PIC68030.1 LytR family transcriptional regulator [Sporosarcina sp. P16a]PIC94339.1 LytR family transcriptional regulator [Sporosarcina sp. P25]
MKKTTHNKRNGLFRFLGVFILIIAILAASAYFKVTNTVKQIHEPIHRVMSIKRKIPVSIKEQEPISLLFLGVDERKGDKGRSDTIIVVTINPTTNTTKMISIPRDTYTEIQGKKVWDKINHAYAFGGIDMSLRTVEHFLDIPIDYVVQINMESFKDIIDAVDGITINNPTVFTSLGSSFSKGTISLTGDQALNYIRMRYEDPHGDFGRQDRQKLVAQAMLRKGASVNSLLNYQQIFKTVENNVRTNMEFNEMMEIQKHYTDALGEIEQLFFKKGHGKEMKKTWYYIPDHDELKELQNEFKMHLNLND